MPQTCNTLTPPAQLTLRAHRPAPARVELVYNPPAVRAIRTILWISLGWGAALFLFWIPPHYPWITAAMSSGLYLAYRSWTGRYRVHSFAGICPRCGSQLSMGADRTIDLPHAVTCFVCHFEPLLEVTFSTLEEGIRVSTLEHQDLDCVGRWSTRWLADEPFLYCASCHAGAPATAAAREVAEREEETNELLARLTDEGELLI